MVSRAEERRGEGGEGRRGHPISPTGNELGLFSISLFSVFPLSLSLYIKGKLVKINGAGNHDPWL